MSQIDAITKENYLNHDKLQERRKLVIGDISGRGKEVLFEVNWNKLVRKNGYIRISIGGEESVISREHLWTILFMLGSAEEQQKLTSPFMKKTKVTKFFKMIGVTAMKDLKKGEMLNVPLEFTLNPDTNQVVIGKGSMSNIKRGLIDNKQLR
jgi:hypothetical protein